MIFQMDPLSILRNMPNVSVGDLDYEQGFDEALLQNPEFADAFSCPIWIGIPRHPIYLSKCQHFFCECCIQNHFITSARIPTNSLLKSAECPCCNKWFLKSEAIPFEEFNYAMKKVYHLVRLRCPNGCGFLADPLEMDDHQSYACGKRIVHCPNPGCEETMEHEKLVNEHFLTCPKRMIFCKGCLLPVPIQLETMHNCKERMVNAMKRMAFQYPLILISPTINEKD